MAYINLFIIKIKITSPENARTIGGKSQVVNIILDTKARPSPVPLIDPEMKGSNILSNKS